MRRARKLATRVLGAVSQDGERLASLERQLTEALQPLGFVSLLALREVERAEEVANRAGSTQTFLAASADLMRTLIRIIDELAPLIDRAIDRIAD